MRSPKHHQSCTTNRRQSWMRPRSATPRIGDALFHRWRQRRWCLLFLSLMWLFIPPLWCQPIPPAVSSDPLLDADQILAFADALFNDGDYFRAITEYKRFLFLYPTDVRAGRVQLQVGRSYQRGQQWDEARQTFGLIAQQYPDAAIRAEAAYLVGETSFQQGRNVQAIADLRPVAERYGQTPVGERARYLLGWSYLRARQWPEASQTFETIDTTSPLFPSSRALADAAREGELLPRKSPALAGLMSAAIPGSGHFYTGRWRDGTIALLLNGAFLAAGIEAV